MISSTTFWLSVVALIVAVIVLIVLWRLDKINTIDEEPEKLDDVLRRLNEKKDDNK